MRSQTAGRSAIAGADSLLVPECVYRPGSFSGLMMLYESNFLKFMRLAGELRPDVSLWVSRVRGDADLFLELIDSERYTSTLLLSYYLRDDEGSAVRDPNMTLRAYHDAGVVEALSCRGDHRHRGLREIRRSHVGELNRRWQRNMMLNKWLDYLLDCGHGFA